MKIPKFKIFVFFLLLILGSLFSCKRVDKSINLLRQAQDIIEDRPVDALILLDSIRNPEKMDENSYMQFLIASVQAKLKVGQDIASDTLIFQAQKYFNDREISDKAALANFCAGGFYRQQGINDKAMECFLQSKTYAIKANNSLLIARSLSNLGNLYFDQDIMDSAIVNYRSAMNYYNRVEGADVSKLKLINLIGRTFEGLNNLDSAYFYYTIGLDMSKEQENLDFQSKFNQNLGVISREKKDYNKASDYFFTALAQTANSADSLRVYLSLIRLHNSTHHLDSAAYYSELMTERLSEIKDNFVLLSMYKSLAEYHQLKGDYKQALYYTNLQKQVNEKILENNNAEKLLNAETNYKLYIEKQKRKSEREYFLLIQIIIILAIVAVFYFITIKRRHKHQKDLIENRRLKAENRLLKQEHDSHIYLESIYQQYILKWAKIENRVNRLGVEDEQVDLPLYTEIKSMSDELKSHTNKQLVKLAKSYLHSHSDIGDKAVRVLTEQELILMILCYFEYSKVAIATILDIKLEKLDLDERKSRIATRLKNAGMTEYDINLILYSEKM